ncbi:universal stress protein [Natrarchaeobius chitinivorans]|uniref:Universal stress protein n=1 Tax=Natrarchaeobius chitinivorans TaxID=1679083 RepID=A0A3N6PIB5_NATCH|nr:universal stress protein [Natrarchaeobius chitinivorans]RQG97985.1 universal stress protein [Natrarchaeobius chitinivorans]
MDKQNDTGGGRDGILDRVIVPVANEDDAESTCRGFAEYVDEEARIKLVHVIEKGGGAPDKAPLEARQNQADETFAVAEDVLDEFEIETELRYGTDVIEEILEAAAEFDATAIAFTPRPSGRVAQLLTGNKTRRLVRADRVPVIVLPDVSNP